MKRGDALGPQRPGRRFPSRVLVHYTLLQVPGWIVLLIVLLLLREYAGLSWPMVGGILLLWMLKDALLYPLLRGAHDPDAPGAYERLVGWRGVAVEDLTPVGYVKVRGELWRAEVEDRNQSLPRNSRIVVTGLRESLLLVRPDAPATPSVPNNAWAPR